MSYQLDGEPTIEEQHAQPTSNLFELSSLPLSVCENEFWFVLVGVCVFNIHARINGLQFIALNDSIKKNEVV